jgi:deoxyribonuclease V
MILAVDVDYRGLSAKVAGVTFSEWDAEEEDEIYVSYVEGIAEYVPGSFYKRELPCILALLSEHNLSPDIIVVDGFVYLNGIDMPGLGKHLHDALDKNIAIVGVAKRIFKGINNDFALCRGESKNPLYITSEGISTNQARDAIARMHGKHRHPTLLKKVDSICREE